MGLPKLDNPISLISDPGGIQTHDLQNRNLTLYSLSYGTLLRGQKYKNSCVFPNIFSKILSKPTLMIILLIPGKYIIYQFFS